MRRRELPTSTPRHLRRFVASEWPADDPIQAAGQFWDAVTRWNVEHPDDPVEFDDPASAPDGPFRPELL